MLLILLICILSSDAFAQFSPYKGSSGKYAKLVWFDEFNYNGLPDTGKWNHENGYIRNKELQYYTAARKENALVQDGYLTITAANDSLTHIAALHAPIVKVSTIFLKVYGD